MIWLGMILAMIWAQSVQVWSEWGFRITILSSLGANLVVAILSGTRRRSAHGRLWGWLGQGAKFCLWLAYQVAEAATTSAIGSLSLCGSNASEEEKQLVAFWASFLLLHLGGPDNLTGYSLEDNKISMRKWLEIVTRILGVIYTIYNNTHRRSRSWALLLAASMIMLLAGAVRYSETAIALGKANLDSMQEDASSSSSEEDVHKMNLLKSRIKKTKRQGRSLRDGAALLLAQDLFPIWRHALVDSSVNPDSERQKASEMILSESDEQEWDWESLCKVAEMELSLIYEFLYTKAILAHTWCFYLIRLLSPLFTAAAAFLFYFWLRLHPDLQQQQGDDGHWVRGSFVGITYALLAITFLMDVAWLLRALGSTWAYAYLREQAPTWLSHQALHASGRWWCSLHRIVVCLDPLQLFRRDPVSHRRWSGTIGRYNLLDECTAATTSRLCQRPEWWPWSKAGDDRPKEMRYLSKLPQCVKKLLFKRVTEILQEAINGEENKKNKKMYNRQDIRTKWGHKALSLAAGKIKLPRSIDQDIIFGQEFEEDILLWHIATCMILPHITHKQKGDHTWAIQVISEYMMFLVAVRRQMLPGLVLHSQLQVTRDKLVDIWDGGKRSETLLPDDEKFKRNNKEKLAMLLRRVRRTETPDSSEEQWTQQIEGNEGTRLLAQAVDLYFYISGDKRPGEQSRAIPWPSPVVPDERLEVIFNVWVDKLVYAAVRCSREVHAKQLSAGGDLTTVLWMLIQHAGPFCMGEAAKDIYIFGPPKAPEDKKKPDEKKPEYKMKPEDKKEADQKKKKEEEEKKKKEEEEKKKGLPLPPPSPPYCPVCPPYYHPSYPPVCPPYYDPSWCPVCPWYPQCCPQHEKPAGDKPEETREDEQEDSSSDVDSEE